MRGVLVKTRDLDAEFLDRRQLIYCTVQTVKVRMKIIQRKGRIGNAKLISTHRSVYQAHTFSCIRDEPTTSSFDGQGEVAMISPAGLGPG